MSATNELRRRLPAEQPQPCFEPCLPEVSAKTVGELRKVTAWPENLVMTTPQDRYPDSAVRVSKVSVATRTSPKSVAPSVILDASHVNLKLAT